MKYAEVQSLVPVEIHSLLQEVKRSLQQLEVKVRYDGYEVVTQRLEKHVEDALLSQVVEAVDRSGPAYRLDTKLSEIQTGLRSVQKKLEQRSSTVTQVEDTQKVKHDEVQAPPPDVLADSHAMKSLTTVNL